LKTQLQILSERLKEFFPKAEMPVMFMMIAMILIGITYNIFKTRNPEKPKGCPTCGQLIEKKNERYIF